MVIPMHRANIPIEQISIKRFSFTLTSYVSIFRQMRPTLRPVCRFLQNFFASNNVRGEDPLDFPRVLTIVSFMEKECKQVALVGRPVL